MAIYLHLCVAIIFALQLFIFFSLALFLIDGQVVQDLSLHELLAEDASLLLYVALEDVGRFAWLASLLGGRLPGGESRLVNRGDQLEHSPAEQLVVSVFELVVDQLLWIRVHQHGVDKVAQTWQLSLFEGSRWTSDLLREVGRCSQHRVHVLRSSVSVHARGNQQLPAVDRSSSFQLAACLQLGEDSVVGFPDLKRLAFFFLPIGPLRLTFLHRVDERLAKGSLAEQI